MLLSIGRKAEASDCVDLLLECHGRIRKFLDTAVKLAGAAQPSEADVAGAAGAVRRYFAEALPLHVADEDQSLVPRLRGRDAGLDEALARMSREHDSHVPQLAALIALCDQMIDTPARHGELRQELAGVAAWLHAELTAHLEHEEALVLPALRTLLGDADRAAILAELRARRGG